MAASTPAGEVDISEIHFDDIPINLSLNEPEHLPSGSSTPEPQPAAGADARRGSPATLFEIDPTDDEKAFVRWLHKRIRRTWWLAKREKVKKIFKKYTPKNRNERITLLLAIGTFTFLIYEYIHMKEPTLTQAIRSTAAAEANNRIAEYNAHINWLTNVCPSEIARNISTPACVEALKEAAPVPPKLEYREVNSVHHMIVRRLVPWVNSSQALRMEMLASDNFCLADRAWDPITSPVNCSWIDPSRVFHKRTTTTIDAWASLSKFPLPSIRDSRMLRDLSARIPITTILFFGLLMWWLYFWLISMAVRRMTESRLSVFTYRHRHFHLQWTQRDSWMVACGYINFITSFFVYLVYTWRLTVFMAKDKLIGTCINHKALHGEMPQECLGMFEASSALPTGVENKVWSIWRGYYSVMIDQYSIDNFVLTFITLGFAWSLYKLLLSRLYCNLQARLSGSFTEPVYLPIRNDSKATAKSPG